MLLDCSVMCHCVIVSSGEKDWLIFCYIIMFKLTDTRLRCFVILIIKNCYDYYTYSSKKEIWALFWTIGPRNVFLGHAFLRNTKITGTSGSRNCCNCCDFLFFTRVSTMIERFCVIKMLTWLHCLWMCVWLLSVSHHSPPQHFIWCSSSHGLEHLDICYVKNKNF